MQTFCLIGWNVKCKYQNVKLWYPASGGIICFVFRHFEILNFHFSFFILIFQFYII